MVSAVEANRDQMKGGLLNQHDSGKRRPEHCSGQSSAHVIAYLPLIQPVPEYSQRTVTAYKSAGIHGLTSFRDLSKQTALNLFGLLRVS